MPTKRKITPLRAASEQRAADKKQVLQFEEIVDSWTETLRDATRDLAATVELMRRDFAKHKAYRAEYFGGQRDRQKRKKGGL